MRFAGVVGYAVDPTETSPGSGVWEAVPVEVPYKGDVIRDIRRTESGENTVNDDLVMNNSISIVADEYANHHFFRIKYVLWHGVRWTVTTIEVKPPRLILNLGEVYNGPTPEAS